VQLEETVSCPHCGGPTNTDCYRLLVRCASYAFDDCGRYSIKPDVPDREVPLFDWPTRDRQRNQ
jgi:hypothetical protein